MRAGRARVGEGGRCVWGGRGAHTIQHKVDSTIKIECLLTIQHKVEHSTIKAECPGGSWGGPGGP